MVDVVVLANAVGLLYIFFFAGAFVKKPRYRATVDNYIVVVVTVGDSRVFSTLIETVEQLERLGLRYVVLTSTPLPLSKAIVVPPEEDGSKYRAIKWFVEKYARSDFWYIFLDDDSYPLDDNFLSDIAYYGAKGYVAGNGVLVPRPGRSKLAYALDWIRYFEDVTRYRLALEILRRPIFGMHGELLIVRGDVLKEIWPKMGESLAEDFKFAMELLKRGYKTFQTSTRVSIKSPNSIKDFIRQRARWSNSLREAAAYGNIPVLLYTASSIIFWATAPLWIVQGPSLAMAVLLYYTSAYIYGSLRARRYIVDVLAASVLEVLGLLVGVLKKTRHFYVIDKT